MIFNNVTIVCLCTVCYNIRLSFCFVPLCSYDKVGWTVRFVHFVSTLSDKMEETQ